MQNTFDFPIEPPLQQESPESENSECFEEYFIDEKKFFRCTYQDCGKIFRFRSEMTRHVVVHFNSRPHQCKFPGCRKSFKRADALDDHMKIHNTEMIFKCTVLGCEEKFANKAALKYHLRKHNIQKSYQCGFPGCGRTFLTLSQLKQHEKAYNYHLKITSPGVEKEPIKITKAITKEVPQVEIVEFFDFSPKEIPDFEKQVFDAAPPSMLKTLQWETRNQDDEILDEPDTDKQEISENLIKYFLQENKVLKQKLDACSNLMNVFQENHEEKTVLEDPFLQEVPNDPGAFFDDSELKFLEYLKDMNGNAF